MKYDFNPEIAKDVGVEEAIMFANIQWWCKKNEVEKSDYHFYNGYYWTFNSINAWNQLFPFWTIEQVRRILTNLEKKGYIKSGNFNKIKYDQTKWYTCIYQCTQIDLGKSPNVIVEINKPIPDNKPDNKHKEINKESLDINQLIDIWNNIDITAYTSKGLPKTKKLSPELIDKIKKKLTGWGLDEFKEGLNNYLNEIIKRKDDGKGYFNHRFTLSEFIVQTNGLYKYINL